MFPEVEEKVALLTPQSETAPPPPPPQLRPGLPQYTQSWPWQSQWRISPWAHQFAHPSSILFAIFCCHLSAAPPLSLSLSLVLPSPARPLATRGTVPAALLYCIWWLAKVSCLYSFIVYKCLISAAPLLSTLPLLSALPSASLPVEPLLSCSEKPLDTASKHFADRMTRRCLSNSYEPHQLLR